MDVEINRLGRDKRVAHPVVFLILFSRRDRVVVWVKADGQGWRVGEFGK